ncbi:tetratricopeptide repeat protein [Lentzea sp. NPDC051838]|uniref:tetratricopeptide repeat protein n=1 Tax=Lentzea sp. NPDC051838 TaxID=3154849 RepID=UPI00342144CB
MLTDWPAAIDEAYRVTEDFGPLTAAQAWPLVMVLYLQGDMAAARAVLARVPDAGDRVLLARVPDAAAGLDVGDRVLRAKVPGDESGDLGDRALLAAWGASVVWAQGTPCRDQVESALALARASGDQRALAAAHTVRALVAAAEGDRRANDRHYALALSAAERAGDRTQQLRIRANRASQRVEEGDLDGGLAELDDALELLPGAHPAMVGLAQHNRADLLLRRGRLDDARKGFRAACLTLQQAGSGIVAYPLAGLGECHELRGDLQQARAAYEEAVRVADETGITPTLVPALCGLARVLAATGDPLAPTIAARAVAHSDGLSSAMAHAAAGWAVVATDPAAARTWATQAIELARVHRAPTALADALELASVAGDTGEDAARVFADIGDQIGVARVALSRAGSAAARVLAEHRLRGLGVDPSTGTRSLAVRTAARTSVRVLGSFAVVRDGEELPPSAWKSRKARDLLKLLIVRRGRPVSREELAQTLWPGESDVANRLSITLSVLRAVLDPTRTAPPVIAGPSGIAYDPRTLLVDVDTFLELAAAGCADETRLLLEAAANAYEGDVLGDEPELRVVQELRDETLNRYLEVMRTLGRVCAAEGDVDGARRAWSRVLERDPYDEGTALRLIDALRAAGRLGEAARQHRRYAERMRELGVPVRA